MRSRRSGSPVFEVLVLIKGGDEIAALRLTEASAPAASDRIRLRVQPAHCTRGCCAQSELPAARGGSSVASKTKSMGAEPCFNTLRRRTVTAMWHASTPHPAASTPSWAATNCQCEWQLVFEHVSDFQRHTHLGHELV